MSATNPWLHAINNDLSLRALAGVLRNAQEGDLPLFAWTLGLPQSGLLSLVRQCFPEVSALQTLPESEYNRLRQSEPAGFEALVAFIDALGSAAADVPHAEWLARTLAAACFGERHLWQDLGLASRDDLSRLLEQHFEPLYLRNQTNLRWKRFIFSEFAKQSADPALLPPGCSRCEQFPICFADDSSDRHRGAHDDEKSSD